MTTVKKAVITAAGKGTRQYPATNTVQKELFPLVDVDGFAKPTLQIIVEEVIESGIDEVCIVANPSNVDAMKRHFAPPDHAARTALKGRPWAMKLAGRLEEIGRRITFVVQESQLGYGHAVLQARDWVGDAPFALLLGDHVYISPGERCTRQAVGAYHRHACPVATVTTVDESISERVGIVRGEMLAGDPSAYKIAAMIEKPTANEARAFRTAGIEDGKYLAFFGIHVFPPLIFECLQELVDKDIRVKGEIQLTSAMELLMHRVERYLACLVDGQRYDMGVPEGYIETQVALALHSPFRDHALRMVEEIELLRSQSAE